jgi:glutathione synthase/RimK-type ligase-like ATP-grasp enzyme
MASLYSSNDEQRLAALRKCPVLFQVFVHGPDYRVHTVGERALATRIKSDGTDYRFAGGTYRAGTLKEAVANRLVSAAGSSGLLLSGVDLRISERDGTWFVFEINRMPAFDFYDHHGGSRVADAIIDLAIN